MKLQLLSFEDYQLPAERLAQKLDIPLSLVTLHRFPDGESRVQLPELSTDHLIICRSLNQPNDKLVELLLVCETARNMGIKTISLVAPYLCYMRQDMAFHTGEAISQLIIGQYLAGLFDSIITVDPHLHRIHDLKTAVPCKKAITLSANETMGKFLATHNKDYILIGPDEESEQWVKTIADIGGFKYGIALKTRFSDRHVEINLPDINLKQADVILVDDMISTGHTLLETTRKVFAEGAVSVNCLITHPLHNAEVSHMLQKEGVNSIWSTDSIINPDNNIHLDSLLAEGIQRLL